MKCAFKKGIDALPKKMSPNMLSIISVTHTLVNDVRPGATVVEKLFVLPRRAGPTTLVATFSSEELFDVKGSAKVDIIRQHV